MEHELTFRQLAEYTAELRRRVKKLEQDIHYHGHAPIFPPKAECPSAHDQDKVPAGTPQPERQGGQ